MLQNTLQKIEHICKENLKFNNDIIRTLLDLFSHYKKDMWVYPGVLKRKCNIDTKTIYELLGQLEQEGILESYFELYCGPCKKTSGLVFRTFKELPDYFYCENCGDEISSVENSQIIYKVVKDD